MAVNYTSLLQAYTDAVLFFSLGSAGAKTLTAALFPSIIRNRWDWFVRNYAIFKERFEAAAAGNINRINALNDLQKFVDGYNLGNTLINPFEKDSNFIKFRPFLDQITIDEMSLTEPEAAIRDEEIKRVRELVEEDFRNMRTFLRQQTAIFANDIGLGDPDANKIVGINDRSKRRSARISDLSRISAINRLVKSIEAYIFNLQKTQKRPPNLLNVAANNLEPGSSFNIVNTYQTSIPTPFEISLESMAKKYLGSEQRWFELVTINNLQPPYVDEVGEKFSFVAPTAGKTVIISSSLKDFVYPGVKVNIGSAREREETRTVEQVVVNQDDTMVIFLDGEPNLGKFKKTEDGFVRVFQPATVRSGSIVLIPLNRPADRPSKKTPKSDVLRKLEDAFINFGVDVFIDEKTGDWVIDANGNFKLAFGNGAVRQSVRNTLRTEQKELPYHKKYGTTKNLGQSHFGTYSEAVAFSDSIISAVLRDARIDDVKIMALAQGRNGSSFQIGVKIKGLDAPIPLTFIS